MTGSTISTLVVASVTLGTSAYPSPLTITSTGDIGPAASSAIALVATIAAGAVLNQGTVTGGGGAPVTSGDGAAGGVGVFLSSRGALTNAGGITGGAGGQSFLGPGGGTGGSGVYDAHSSIANGATGIIAGGAGGQAGSPEASGDGGGGGVGVHLTGGSLANSGAIIGGEGGLGGRGRGGACCNGPACMPACR
jgi:hypothetical protein